VLQVALHAFLALILPTEAGSLFGGSDVVEYAPGTFNATVLSDPRMWVVVYYADWCGHCIHYAPTFKRMATGLLKERSRLRLGALNCAVHTSFCSSIGVHSYPSVRAYHTPGMKESWEKPGADVPRKIVHDQTAFPKWVLERLPASSSSSQPALAPQTAAEPPPTAAPPAAAAPPGAGRDSGAAQPPPTAVTQVPPGAARAALPAEAGSAPHGIAPDAAALRLVDAEVALLYSLRQGAFLAATSPAGQPSQLLGTALAELRAWLEFLAQVLPGRQACSDVRALAAVVGQAQESAEGALLQDAWTQALDKQGIDSVPPQAGRDPTPYWRLCRTYSCGLWTLFHIITLAAAEWGRAPARGFLAAEGSSLPAPQQALGRLRGFVSHFFGCQECASNFVQTFDSCGLGRCELDALDGEGAALWLWQVHNGVTKRVQTATGGAAAPWPPLGDCHACWDKTVEGKWDAKAVYAHLKASYWQPDWAPGGQAAAGSPDFALAGGLFALAALGYFLYRCLSAGGILGREKGS